MLAYDFLCLGRYYNDLFQFDPGSLHWTDLSLRTRGGIPFERSQHSFRTWNGKLIAFAGHGPGSKIIVKNFGPHTSRAPEL
jgi:hypothetical protein